MNKNLITISFIVVILIAGGIIFYLYNSLSTTQTEMEEMVEMMNYEKEQLENEEADVALEIEGMSIKVNNDSLLHQLDREQKRVQLLLEELRTVKATNARRIAELKKELATVRQVMVSYVHQIDSLDRTNKRLVKENQQVKQQYQEVARQAQQLEEERTQLVEVVSRASMLEITQFQMIPLNKRDRKTSIYNQIQKLQFDYTIAKNITCERGLKDLYVRVITPNGVLMNEAENKRFPFESDSIAYSITQQFEYSGEQYVGTVYLPITEEVEKGFYTIDFFCDGNLIGSYPIQVRK